MKIIVEGLKSGHEGQHLEQKRVGGAHPHTQQYWVSNRGEHVSGPHPSVKAAKAAADAHGRAWGGAYQPWKKGWGEGEHVGGWANRYAVSRQRGRDAAPVVPNEAARRQQAAFDAMTPEEHDAQADSHAWTAIGQGTMDPKFHHDRAAVHREAASTKRAKRDAMLAANPEFRPHVEARIKADKEVAAAKAARAGRQPGPPPESSKALHLEQRQVHGAHGTHMQRFWVGGASTHDEHVEHAKLHEKAAAEHGALAKKHGAGLYPDVMPGADPTHAIAAEMAINPHWDPERGDAHKMLASLHRQAAGMSLGLAGRTRAGLPTSQQQKHLDTVRDHIDDQTFYARPSSEVADDLYEQKRGEDEDAYNQEHMEHEPFDVPQHGRLERLKSQMAFDFGAPPSARGLHLEQKRVGGHTQGVWVKSKDHPEHGEFKDFGHDPHGTHTARNAAQEHHRQNAGPVGAAPQGNASHTAADRDGNIYRIFHAGAGGAVSTWGEPQHGGAWSEDDPWDEGPGGVTRRWDSRRHLNASYLHSRAARTALDEARTAPSGSDQQKAANSKWSAHMQASNLHQAAVDALRDEPSWAARAVGRIAAIKASKEAGQPGAEKALRLAESEAKAGGLSSRPDR